MKPTAALALLASLVTPALADQPPAADEPRVTDFIRVDEDQSAARLQTAVTRFRKGDATVELVGAIHIADKAYYDKLNRRFDGYDALLFEMIGGQDPEARKKPAEGAAGGGGEMGALHQVYDMVSRFLGLTGQMSHIDYSKANFVHADLSFEEFTKLQEERGESLLGFALQAGVKAQQEAEEGGKGGAAQPDMARLLQAMLTGNSNRMKLEIVHTLGAGDDQIAAFAGENVIIGDRNAKCLRVLDEQVAGGKRKLGIFYGAAHFPDMEKRLAGPGWKREHQEWLTAWDIPKPKPQPAAEDRDAA